MARRNPHEETSRAGNKPGYGNTGSSTYRNVHDTGAVTQTPGPRYQPSSGNGNQKTTKTKTKTTTEKDVGLGISILAKNPLGIAWNILSRPFNKKTELEKVQANIKKGYDVNNPAEMRSVEKRYKSPSGSPHDGGGNKPLTTLITQSVVSSPTADKAHEWDFKAYDNQQAAKTPNVYNYAQAPYAKKGKLIRQYATGQEIKNFSKGKRFGPPPLKGPDSQGLPVILENSDYFKKLIG